MVFLYSFLWRTTRWSSKPLRQLTGSLKKKVSSALQNGWRRALWLCGFLHWKANVLGHVTACFSIQGGLCLSDSLPVWWHQLLHWWWSARWCCSGQAVPWAETVLLVTYLCSWHRQPGLAKSRPQGRGRTASKPWASRQRSQHSEASSERCLTANASPTRHAGEAPGVELSW